MAILKLFGIFILFSLYFIQNVDSSNKEGRNYLNALKGEENSNQSDKSFNISSPYKEALKMGKVSSSSKPPKGKESAKEATYYSETQFGNHPHYQRTLSNKAILGTVQHTTSHAKDNNLHSNQSETDSNQFSLFSSDPYTYLYREKKNNSKEYDDKN